MNNLVPYSKQSTYLATPERSKWVQEAGNTVFDENDPQKNEAPKKKKYHLLKNQKGPEWDAPESF